MASGELHQICFEAEISKMLTDARRRGPTRDQISEPWLAIICIAFV